MIIRNRVKLVRKNGFYLKVKKKCEHGFNEEFQQIFPGLVDSNCVMRLNSRKKLKI